MGRSRWGIAPLLWVLSGDEGKLQDIVVVDVGFHARQGIVSNSERQGFLCR